MASTYEALVLDHRVKSVSFPGGGIGVVVLEDGYTSGGEKSITAGFFRSAQKFVNNARKA